jgi:aldehyde dehydrogenase (NAD+)
LVPCSDVRRAGVGAGAIIGGDMTLTKKGEARPAAASWGLAARGGIPWEYAPAPESSDHVRIEPEYGLFIDNEFRPAKPRKTFGVINPATEEPLARVALASKADVDRAVRAARRAHDTTWSRLSGAERAKYLYRIARIMQERSREFAVVETLNSGKPIKESRDVDVPLAAAHFFYYAGWADKIDHAFPGRVPQPLGVAAQIIPWNFPLLMLAWKIAPALACGNTVVLKPASTTPLTAYLFADVVRQAELPPGVVNIITGPGAIGMELVRHPEVNKVAFTGSTAVGKLIARAVAGTRKKATLELGDKAANIVFDDAPLDQAIEGIINGIYFNQGEVCCAGSRLFVQESVYEPLIEKLKARLGTLRVGDPMDKNTDVGAINSAAQLAKITELVESGTAEGAEIFQPECQLPERGYFFRPTLFTGVSQSHRIAQEEIFGPVLSVLTFRTPDEAIEKANNTPYGLSAGVWTEKGSRIFKMVAAMRAGVVWANTFNRFDPTSPFGGYKESGYGREGGLAGLAAYLRLDGEH